MEGTDQMIVLDLGILQLPTVQEYYGRLEKELKALDGRQAFVYCYAEWCDDCETNERNFHDFLESLPEQAYWQEIASESPKGSVPIIRIPVSISKHDDFKEPDGTLKYLKDDLGNYVLNDKGRRILVNPFTKNLGVYEIPLAAVMRYDAGRNDIAVVGGLRSFGDGEPSLSAMHRLYAAALEEVIS